MKCILAHQRHLAVPLVAKAMYRSKETGRDRVSVAPLPLRRRRGEAMEFLLDETLC